MYDLLASLFQVGIVVKFGSPEVEAHSYCSVNISGDLIRALMFFITPNVG